MLEFLKDLASMLFGGRIERRLPDCVSILFLINRQRTLDARGAARYVALCRLTTLALVLRWISVASMASTLVLYFAGAPLITTVVDCAIFVSTVAMFGMLSKLAEYLASDYVAE